MRALAILVILFSLCLKSQSIEHYDLPIVPHELNQQIIKRSNVKSEDTNKYIPQIVWIAVRNKTDDKPKHFLGPEGFLARNKNWQINFCDNDDKDAFMEKYYSGSSILWAYNIINPAIGTAKVELWRLAVLYLHGGMYMDDDSDIKTKLDDIVQQNDKFIAGKETYDADDRCFKDFYPLSDHALNRRFGAANQKKLFGGKFFFNWALFSNPGNILLYRVMKHIVALIKYEYFGLSAIKMGPRDHRGKLLQCASTYPITLAARELVLEGKSEEMGLRVPESEMFTEYGADMKAWFNDYNPNRWVTVMQKRRAPYLKAYSPPIPSLFEGHAVQAHGQKAELGED